MKRLIIVLCAFVSVWTFSQTMYSNQSIGVLGGGATGKKGFYIQLNYSRIIGEKGFSGRGDFIFINQKAKINNIPTDDYISLKQYMILPSAQYTFEEWGLEPFFISVYGGGMLGYEVVNKGKKELPNSGIVSDKLKNNFIYGVSIGVEGQMEISREAAAFINISELYRLNSSVGNFSFMIGAGFKYYF